ncbi:phage terminase small subunit-related protein [Brevibacillus laterosporus]|uniref:Phage terminase small subunit-related protein n=1 Tax=Brevibacillus laterosporus TaxID=1465 RepID=A0AAP3G9P0_BRELA|nr:phage terminase small subunit-related protein [Brevibacillus laterosporus]MCR8981631.1 phage terminase small subunit-related protein [Brevibacillus laterosporus]MCZ0808786.1 phage terminase small subunit-related protein [Brevibacillus laterosporus]MCZ0827241.1 phage terminase small subunit-related protein [Brevibacillus laterosporus]MCZ0850997.1 phage terminase small subunit-related protein [Brevibacillus laterosporus]
MPRERNPNRDKAYKIWLEHNGNITNRQIAEMLGENEKVIAVWKQRDKWNVVQQSANESCTTKKRGAPKGSKNAVGNKGGAPLRNKNAVGNSGGAPPRNTNAVKTGEYQTLWMDALTPEQQEIVERVNLDPLEQVNQSITLYAWREREIMMKIAKLEKGLTEKQRRVLQERVNIKEPVQVHDEKSGKPKTVILTRNELATTKIEETEYRVIEDILNLQEALTRVTDKKLRAVEMKHKLIIAKGPNDDEGGKSGLDQLAEVIVKSATLIQGDS